MGFVVLTEIAQAGQDTGQKGLLPVKEIFNQNFQKILKERRVQK